MLDNATVADLIARYNSPVPRYTSYPTALEFGPLADTALEDSYRRIEPASSVSVYVHLPFCANLCLYCGCNVLLSRKKEVLDEYIPLLLKEIDRKTALLDYRPRVSQLHFGGGTPNFLRLTDWDKIFAHLRRRFDFVADAEISAEFDPMVVEDGYLEHVRGLGMNRMSYGVQDVTPKVLEAVNRPQDVARIRDVVVESRRLGFSSVNIDLIYGLPHQTEASYQANLEFIGDIKPERIALFSFAHVPWLKHHQRRLDVQALARAEEKLRIYLGARKHFAGLGYEQIGMDHFGLKHDTLTRAFHDKTLHRNFMGYTTQKTLDMLAFGTSAIGFVSGVYMQNHVKLSGWRSAINDGRHWFEKGYIMSDEDRVRSEIITALMANFYVNFTQIENDYGVDFHEHFAPELAKLQQFADEGHGELTAEHFTVNETGGFIIRHIASVFDAYRKESEQKAFSKAI
ncbi:MAG: oxygen-independent coproporphyrinogen III oxidase [Spirochaetes bacterium]|nr:oxygen-independent coproporphyrinogen III oxidase [Spirochaetota bacterium]